jgi:hypothetical protein
MRLLLRRKYSRPLMPDAQTGMASNAGTKASDALVAGTALTSSTTILATAQSAPACIQHVTRRKKPHFARSTQKGVTFAPLIASNLVLSQQHLQQHAPRHVTLAPRSTQVLHKRPIYSLSGVTSQIPDNRDKYPLSASLSLFPSFSSQNDELFFGFVLGLTPLTKFDQIFFAGAARKPLCEWLIFEAF